MLDTLSNVKSRLGITGTDYDSFLTQQITLISDVIESYCRRKFKSASWTQTFYKQEIRDVKSLELYHFPLISLTSITIDGTALTTDELNDIVIHKPTAMIRRGDGSWIYGKKVVVVYTAGYATVPSAVLSVLDSLVQERYNKKVAGVDLNFGSDVQRISIPGTISIDFDYSLSNNERKSSYGSIIGSYANILDDWRSERSVVGSSTLQFVEAL
mgnify:CR=1 FL=1